VPPPSIRCSATRAAARPLRSSHSLRDLGFAVGSQGPPHRNPLASHSHPLPPREGLPQQAEGHRGQHAQAHAQHPLHPLSPPEVEGARRLSPPEEPRRAARTDRGTAHGTDKPTAAADERNAAPEGAAPVSTPPHAQPEPALEPPLEATPPLLHPEGGGRGQYPGPHTAVGSLSESPSVECRCCSNGLGVGVGVEVRAHLTIYLRVGWVGFSVPLSHSHL